MNLARGVLLGGTARPKQQLTIVVPREYADSVMVGRCLVPGCGAVFYQGQEELWQRHVGECARRNMDRILAAREEHRQSIFHPGQWDPEAEQHVLEVGRRMRKEGRLEMRESEKIVNG